MQRAEAGVRAKKTPGHWRRLCHAEAEPDGKDMAEDGGHAAARRDRSRGGEVLAILTARRLLQGRAGGWRCRALGSERATLVAHIAAAVRMSCLRKILTADTKGDRAQEVRQRDGDEPGVHCLLDKFIKRNKDVVNGSQTYRLRGGGGGSAQERAGWPVADAITVAGEVELFYLGVVAVGEGDVDEADGLSASGRALRGRDRRCL